jgi:pSer/pThr/pTyr-binding forkhead associated (FHA) protein
METGPGATLLIRGGPNSGVTVQLSAHPVILGRRSDNDVVIDETTVSRRHSLIMESPDGFVLRDFNTTNGTFVNRIKIGQTEYPLRHGDQISLGGSEVTLVFRMEGPSTQPVDTDAIREGTPEPGQAKVLSAADATLNPVDAALLSLLASRKGTVVSRSEILETLWPGGVQSPESSMELDESAVRLRTQLTQDPGNDAKLVTVGSFGYVLI